MNIKFFSKNTIENIFSFFSGFRSKHSFFIVSIVSFFLFVLAAAIAFIPSLSGVHFSPFVAVCIAGIYLVEFLINVIYEAVCQSKNCRLENLNTLLNAEHAQLSAMKDHLKSGIFLMDRDFIIQEQYTKPLESTLDETELAGKKFTDFLGASVNAKELETLIDYFNMVMERSFDEAMLEDINPIQQFKYIHEKTEKILHCGFTAVDQPDGDVFILGNIEDITEAVRLKEQVKKEEAKRQEDMSSLFEVLQIDPTVCSDFLEDTDYEFDKINSLLKDTNVSSKETLVDIFQSVHAIKANAIILGLSTFSEKVHNVETKIKTLSEQFDVSFNDTLNLLFDIESIMKEKDRFGDTINKIRQFGAGGEKKKYKDVLVDALKRAASRTSEDIGKKVEFVVRSIEESILDQSPRRVIKEVLLQLVRNSVFHGIESPAIRKSAGKSETGIITLSITKVENNMLIRLQDDGKGLDFSKIEERARQMHLIKKNEAVPDKNRMLQAIFAPGFSTAEKESIHAGRGIGLNLVHNRIKDIGGIIKLQTEQGKGTVFNIFIPLL